MKLALFEVNPPAKSHLVWNEGKVMLFRRPAEERRMGVLMLVAVAVQIVVDPLTGAILTGKTFWWVMAALGAGLTCYFCFVLKFAGPNDIRLDGNERTYEWTTGWWKPVTRQGSFEDIAGVCVSPRNAALLIIKKFQQPHESVPLLDFGPSAAAQALAEEVSRTFGFPIVPYPK